MAAELLRYAVVVAFVAVVGFSALLFMILITRFAAYGRALRLSLLLPCLALLCFALLCFVDNDADCASL